MPFGGPDEIRKTDPPICLRGGHGIDASGDVAGRSRPGATLYFHAATGLRFEAAPSGGGGGASGRPEEVLYTPIELGALAGSLPVYMRQEVALSARDWPAFYGKVLQAVGAGAKAAARAKAAAQQG